MASVGLTVTGLAELKAALAQLPGNVSKNVLRGAVYAGAKVITNAVSQAAPVFTGTDPRVQAGLLKSAVYMKHDQDKSGVTHQEFFVSIRRGRKEKAKGRDAYYWTWVEFGHHVVPRAPNGSAKLSVRQKMVTSGSSLVVGSSYVLPHPFFRPAFEASKEASAKAIRDYMAKRIPLEIAKLGPR